MEFKKVTAIFPPLDLAKVEASLMAMGVPGMTVSRSHGYGEYRDFYSRDTMTDYVRLEIFVEAAKAGDIVSVIEKTVREEANSDAMIAVLPVESVIHVRRFGG